MNVIIKIVEIRTKNKLIIIVKINASSNMFKILAIFLNVRIGIKKLYLILIRLKKLKKKKLKKKNSIL
jgi:hypothetical protein